MKSIKIAHSQAHPAAHPEHFSGRVRMQDLYKPDPGGREPELLAVFFEAGIRTKPHTHDSAQVLHVVDGQCVVATEAGRRILRAGELAIIPKGTWHWHGATAEEPMCHVSIKPPGQTAWDVPLRDWGIA